MSLLNYINTSFYSDQSSLPKQDCNEVVRATWQTDYLRYLNSGKLFGGHSWSNYKKDIAHVAASNQAYFCVSLFMMVAADQNMHANFREQFEGWDETMKYPKFGWCGFGWHNENPRFLLSVPTEAGVDFSTITQDEIGEAVQFMHQQGNRINGLNQEAFFRALVAEDSFNFDHPVSRKLVQAINDHILNN